MTTIALDKSRDGLAGFPDGFEPIARDDLGDVFGVDERGAVWLFEHGGRDWGQKSPAFASTAQVEAHIAFQAEFDIPDGEDLAALKDRKKRLQAFAKSQSGAPYSKRVVKQVLEDLTQAIKDRRFWESKAGTSLAARQALGQRCERVLRENGVPGNWMIRPHSTEKRALVVVGRFAKPWTQAEIEDLLRPILGDSLRLHCHEAPPSW